MKYSVVAILAAAAALLVTPSAATAQSASVGGCSRVLVESAEDATGVVRNRDASFSASEVLDVQLTALLTGSWKADHVVEFRLFTPTGSLYQSIQLPFTAESKNVGKERVVEGYARPVPAVGISSRQSGLARVPTVSTSFPVGGTSITQNSIYGTWRLEAYLDGAAQPCGKAAVFAIEP
jgi:hypothetical protein